ncbi:non-ribosomal peptide synthetase, partial [Agrobacterium vitis]|nr:non-ribosomal peptide synthetase [Allorhizobium ampelinum]
MNEFYKKLAGLSPERRAILEKKLAEQRLAQLGQSSANAIARRPSDMKEPPLSFIQQRLWFMQQLEPGNIAYNMMSAMRLKGPLYLTAFGQAINTVVARHETLRTRFILGTDNEPRQIIEPIGPVPVTIIDLGDEAEPEIRAREHIQTIAAAPFDLALSPLRITLLRLASQDHLLSIAMHHIVSDRWSHAVFIRELSLLYRAATLGETTDLPELPVQYADWALWERENLQGERLQKQLDYWTSALSGELPLLDFPFDRQRSATASFRGAHYHFRFDPALSLRLRDLARRHGVSLFTLLLTAYKVLIQRYTGTDDILAGIDVANRDRAEMQSMIGPLVNTLVVRNNLSGDPPFDALLKSVAERVREAMAHQDIPFERVVQAVNPERRLGEMAPLFQAKFDLQQVPLEIIAPDGIVLERYPLKEQSAKFELRFNMEDVGSDISGKVEYATDLFDETTIARLANHYQVLLEAIADDPRQSISTLRLMSEAEEKALLLHDECCVVVTGFNDTSASYPSDRLIHELFEAQVERTPEAVAVVYDEASLSYGELNARANR